MSGKHPRRRRKRRKGRKPETVTQLSVASPAPAPLNFSPAVPITTIRQRFQLLKGVRPHA